MIRILGFAAAVLVGLGGAAQAQGIDPINTRQTGLDLLSGTFANVRNVVAANGDVKTLEASGKAIQRWGTLMPSLFPPGSDKGATKAAPAIWTDNAGFQTAAAALASAGGMLAGAAKAGDVEAVKASVKAIGDACGACHKGYRLQ